MAKFVSAPTHFRNLNMLQSYGTIYVVELLLVKRNVWLYTLRRDDSVPAIAVESVMEACWPKSSDRLKVRHI